MSILASLFPATALPSAADLLGTPVPQAETTDDTDTDFASVLASAFAGLAAQSTPLPTIIPTPPVNSPSPQNVTTVDLTTARPSPLASEPQADIVPVPLPPPTLPIETAEEAVSAPDRVIPNPVPLVPIPDVPLEPVAVVGEVGEAVPLVSPPAVPAAETPVPNTPRPTVPEAPPIPTPVPPENALSLTNARTDEPTSLAPPGVLARLGPRPAELARTIPVTASPPPVAEPEIPRPTGLPVAPAPFPANSVFGPPGTNFAAQSANPRASAPESAATSGGIEAVPVPPVPGSPPRLPVGPGATLAQGRSRAVPTLVPPTQPNQAPNVDPGARPAFAPTGLDRPPEPVAESPPIPALATATEADIPDVRRRLPTFEEWSERPGGRVRTESTGLPFSLPLAPPAGPRFDPPVVSATPVDRPAPIAAQVADGIVTRAELVREHGSTEFRLRLDPPELGTIEVRLVHTADRGIRAEVSTASDAVRHVIEGHLPELRERLEAAGVRFDRLDLATQSGTGERDRRPNAEEPLEFVPPPRRASAAAKGYIPRPVAVTAGTLDITA